MKCSQAHKLISDYIDDLLIESKAHKLERHFQKCTDCSNLFVGMKSMVSVARNLKKPQPSEDVWLSIKHYMTEKNRKAYLPQKKKREFLSFFKYHQRLAIASSVLLSIIVFTFLFYDGFPFVKTESNDPTKHALHHFKEAEKHYQLAIDSLIRTMPDYKVKLSPDLAAVFKENLAIIDNSIRLCHAAIKEYPDNKAANAILMTCYKKKLELLNEIRDLTMRAG